MQVKTYSGSSSKAVLDQIKAELGLDAVILETRNVKENGQTVVRMTAALERAPVTASQPAASGAYGMSPASLSALAGAYSQSKAQAERLAAPPVSAGAPFSAPPVGGGASAGPTGAMLQRWQEEWKSIKRHLFALMKPGLKLEMLTDQQRLSLEYLEREGVSDPVLMEVYQRLVSDPAESVIGPLAQLVPVRPWGLDEWRQRIHLVTGPYGSGKTTSVVRMALALQKERPTAKVCLVNADAERGSGRLLLRHYAGLSDFPYREAQNPADMTRVVSEIRSQGFDRIIVDLPALPKGQDLTLALGRLGLSQAGYDAIAAHLVLPPHYDDATLNELLPRYRVRSEGSIIWSKLDEAERYASLLNVCALTGLPVSALSFGPALLGTFAPAKSALVWRLIFKHELPPAASNVTSGVSQ